MKKLKTEDTVQRLVNMRIKDMASSKTCMDYLLNELGYKRTFAYELLRRAKAEVVKYYEQSNLESLKESVVQLENLAEELKRMRNYKVLLEVRRELSKLQGHYVEKIQHSGTVEHKIDVIKIIAPPDGTGTQGN